MKKRFTAGRLRASLALLAAVCLGAVAAAGNRSELVPLHINVKLKPGVTATQDIRRAVDGLGIIVDRQNGVLKVKLFSDVTLDDAMKLAASRTQVAGVEAIQPKMPMSVKSEGHYSHTRDAIEAYQLAWKEFQPYRPDKGETKVPGLGFLRSYEEWMRLRAYPNDVVDRSGYIEYYNDVIRDQGKIFDRNARVSKLADNRWKVLGPTNLSIPYRTYYGQTPNNGRVNALAFHPTNASTYFMGAPQGGVWKTTDAGATWTPLTDDWPTLGVSAIAVHPTQPDTLLVGTGDYHGFDTPGIGIMRSTNGGLTWNQTLAPNLGANIISRIVFAPSNPSIVLASTQNGIYRSTDAGANWTRVVSGGSWSDLVVGPDGNGGSVFYASKSGSPNVQRSVNLGQTWTQTTQPGSGASGAPALAASPRNANTVYFLDTSNNRVFKSTNAGTSWSDITGNHPGDTNWSQSWYDYHIYCSYRMNGNTPVDVVYIGLITLTQSIDGGSTWRHVGGTNFTSTYSGTAITHNDQHSLAINPNNPNQVLVGNDGGAYIFNYNPANDSYTWNNLNKNLGITQFYTLDTHPTNKNIMLGGTQDNASPYSNGDLLNWLNPGAGDGAGVAINKQNPNNQYTSWQFHGIYRTNNAWASKTDISPNLSGHSVPFIGRLVLDPNNPRYLYINTDYVNRYDAQTNSWSLRLGNQDLSNGQVRAIAVAPGDSNIIYAGTEDGRVWKSSDFGATWVRINPAGTALPNRAISSISVHPTNKHEILVTLNGSGGGSLWKCGDTTNANPIWVSASGSGANGLPNLSANTVVRHPANANLRWFVGTDVGCFGTNDGGATWFDYGRALGLPNVEVSQLTIEPLTMQMTASTFGRGIWQIDLIETKYPVTSLVLNPTAVRGGLPTTATVTIGGPASIAGDVIELSTNMPGIIRPPATVTIPAGQTTHTFQIPTAPVANTTTGTVTAKGGGGTATASLTLNPAKMVNLTLTPTSQTSGFTAVGTIQLDTATPPSGITVQVSSSNPAAGVPSTVVIAGGASQGTFIINCNPVSVPTSLNITATLGSVTLSRPFTVLPPNTYVAHPTSAVPSGATFFEGDANRTWVSDNLYLGWTPTSERMKFVAVDFLSTAPISTLSELKVVLETKVDDPAVSFQVQAFSYTKNSWLDIGTMASSAADSSKEFTLATPGQYVNSSSKQMRVRVIAVLGKGARTTWKSWVDLVEWRLKG